MQFGMLLPHFGSFGDPERIMKGSILAEAKGFESVWVRDHLIFEPHGEFEQPNRTFYEAMTVLTAIGAATERLVLGTGALIPFRHPIQLAQLTGTMANLFPGRLIIGMGAGNSDRQFEQIGLGGVFRPELVRSNANILRKLWTEDDVSYSDEYYTFDGVTLEPKPAAEHLPPFWYCGNTPKSARMAVEFGDGWLPGRIGIETLKARVDTLVEHSVATGRTGGRPTVGIIPTTSVESTREKALATVNVPGLLEWANKSRFWVKPPSGTFETVDDLGGVLIAGTPDDVVEQCLELAAAGVEHLVFDVRLKFERWYEQIEMLGEEVIPRVRAALA